MSVLGLGFDLSAAWALAIFGGIPLPAAAFLGFVVGATFNYVLHQIWTFRSHKRGLHAERWLLYGISLGITLATRIAAVALMGRFLFTGARQEFPILLAATAISFVVNYTLCKYLVFRSEKPAARIAPEQAVK